MVSTTKDDRTEKLGITLPKLLLYNLDNKRGDIPRSTFIRRAVESYMKTKKER
jgi:metal-responsive CopG/Arc/MetJ family transcriptional regulator